ncbi:MAG: hypothetical protein Q8P24_02060 [Desulfobacterales bacterium]|nr:hypothetical protein [Desulfobacterales bacterium]MDZ4341694.1 hypothetical protein [Candidatus Binatia bacterium]
MKPKPEWTGADADLRAGMFPREVATKWGFTYWAVSKRKMGMGLPASKPGRAAHAIQYTAEQDADLGNVNIPLPIVWKKWGLNRHTAYARRKKLLRESKVKEQAGLPNNNRRFIMTKEDLAEMLERKRKLLGLDPGFFYGPWMQNAGRQYLGR